MFLEKPKFFYEKTRFFMKKPGFFKNNLGFSKKNRDVTHLENRLFIDPGVQGVGNFFSPGGKSPFSVS